MQSTFSVNSGMSASSRMTTDSSSLPSQRKAEFAEYNNAFHDLSPRASIFRNQLIEEFQVLDNLGDTTNAQAPTYTSRDMRGAEK
ncbi:MAG: hypothetical protein BJ554DRAFT_5319 [Olpidium bornovanus]|uniref:Uncharacterized protein n=1 Tax=Olpidium bornovanus TaxID=278681 RepID=A0A8H8A0F3_9FUNG|nr:MAG: hypothetical protein BJ554DRAFT_5319 [Olpidium bornovanus]